MSLGTASMCISKWVYETPANVRRQLLIYFNKERRCPAYFNKELRCPSIVLVARGLHLGVLVLGNPSGIRVVDRRLS